MNDCHLVPDNLHNCLEAASSKDASPMTLEQHLPRLGQIIVPLLQGLKVRQSKRRAAKQEQEVDQAHTSISSLPNRPPGRERLPPIVQLALIGPLFGLLLLVKLYPWPKVEEVFGVVLSVLHPILGIVTDHHNHPLHQNHMNPAKSKVSL
ncbi:uncharacterized protein MELLADRAFT_93217 [Melampsora larici-populina 98AG31]|uniref:Aip3p/Bud6 N-terminal domain-containing protein n=1 Tax=Melampsora larici-populina (strain 98AG31 / pathotype 3-4-7) TaxID=747676 RepID=F4S489_MELLP|nr:uncharacterized protein MELLADRAFT_93217 [Melampsora larici-populina 98AG31]EGG00545.1 hypothetical protein MELLADRAFT_93217 [Melampsora larici-populina 98AG31]